jgi:hypothetical protein
MNNELVNGIISNVISDKLSQMLDEMSTNEFLDQICDKIYDELGIDVLEDDDTREKVGEMIGDKVFPLVQMVSNYVLENIVKKD